MVGVSYTVARAAIFARIRFAMVDHFLLAQEANESFLARTIAIAIVVDATAAILTLDLRAIVANAKLTQRSIELVGAVAVGFLFTVPATCGSILAAFCFAWTRTRIGQVAAWSIEIIGAFAPIRVAFASVFAHNFAAFFVFVFQMKALKKSIDLFE